MRPISFAVDHIRPMMNLFNVIFILFPYKENTAEKIESGVDPDGKRWAVGCNLRG